MRAGIVAIIFFAALLALGHYVAAPFFCRGSLAIPSLDPRALCGADMHLNRSGSVLLYFASIAAAVFFGIVAMLLPSRGKPAAAVTPEVPAAAKAEEAKQPEATAAETFEQIAAAEEQKAAASNTETNNTEADASAGTPERPVAHPSALQAHAEAASVEDVTPVTETPPITEATPEPAAAPEPEVHVGPTMAAAEAAQATIMGAIASPAPQSPPAAVEIDLAPPVVKKAGGPFDGSNDELMEHFRELKKEDGVSSIAQAQRLLDESTMSALSRGVDPKAHLSQVAHLVLTEDPDLKSAVVRGVVVHIAARLKELGIAKPNFSGVAKGAA